MLAANDLEDVKPCLQMQVIAFSWLQCMANLCSLAARPVTRPRMYILCAEDGMKAGRILAPHACLIVEMSFSGDSGAMPLVLNLAR